MDRRGICKYPEPLCDKYYLKLLGQIKEDVDR